MEARTYVIVGGAVLVLGLLSFFMSSTKRVETHYTEAETLYQHRNYEGAIEKYQRQLRHQNNCGQKQNIYTKISPHLEIIRLHFVTTNLVRQKMIIVLMTKQYY